MGKRNWKEACIAFFRSNAVVKTGALVLAAVILVAGVCVAAHGLLFSKKDSAGSRVQNEVAVPEEVAVAEEDAETQETVEVAEVTDYAAVFMVTINPQLKIYVDADGIVLWVEAINDDAKALLETFSGEGKELKECFGQLLDKAYEAGYLHDNATVSIKAESMTDVDIEDMLDSMEQAAKTSCEEKGINIKMAVNKQDADSTIEKDIIGKKKDKQQSAFSDQTIGNVAKTVEQEEETVEQPTQPAQDTPDSSSGSSSNDDGNNSSTGNGGSSTPAPTPSSGYHLVWADEFNGTELNRADWNVELHEPGWVNAELQKYVDSTDNISVKDGKLIITPIQTENNGKYSYTSGRINTQNKHDFKYGKFEARVKVPEGMGYLPAFWLMATDENVYGQWPRCGEIDIMEVMGQTPNKLHGTIHYGHNSSDGHHESQGTYLLNNGTFSEKFHTFTCEWEPGKITWYVDGIKYHEESDWYTAKSDGSGELTYPAPFDQNFYIILNLAVGGSWVGYPDDETFVARPYEVDYVRVYQKDKYDENVKKPETGDVIIREPDDNDNYLINGDFETAESLTDAANWQFKTAGTGVGSATIIEDEKMDSKSVKITTENAGDVDYAIQLLQDAVPLQAGGNYTLKFDAYASADREVKVNSKAPNNGWYAYLDKTIKLTTTPVTYSYDFTMIHADDAECTVEFNMGALGSTADIVIDNVSLVLNDIDENLRESIINPPKTVRADGNYIYNGEFQEGDKHLGYWNVPNGANVSVTSLEDGRRLKVVVPSNGNVTISQDNVPVVAGQKYELSLDAAVPAGGSVNIGFDGTDYTVPAGTNGSWSQDFTTTSGTDTRDITIAFNGAGTYYLDNVRIDEDALIKNGSFKAGFSGFEPFVDGSASASYVVDTMNGDSAASFTINNTGDQDWKVQLKQSGVELKEGQWYKLSLKMKSNKDRKVQVNIQRDGNLHNDDWTPYVQQMADVTSAYQTFTYEFQMTEADDAQSVFNISMGAVAGIQISTQHTVVIDEIVLEEIEAPEEEEIPVGKNLIMNPTFANNGAGWEASIKEPGTYTYNESDGSVTFDIKDVGVNDYDAQLKTFGIPLEKGASYKVSFKASSTVDRSISVNVMSSSYAWYGGTGASLTSSPTTFDFTFDMSVDNANAGLFISMGKMADEETPSSVITISDISIIKTANSTGAGKDDPQTGGSTGGSTVPAGTELIKNGDFANAGESWEAGINAPADASVDYSDNKATFTINNVGTQNWHLQLKQNNLALENGESYQVTFKIKSSVDRSAKWALLDPNNEYHWYGGEAWELTAGTEKEVSYTVNADATSGTVQFQITMAPDDDSTHMPEGTHTIEISDVSVKKTSGGNDDSNTGDAAPTGTELIQNGDFANAGESWEAGINAPADASVDYSDNKATFTINNVGTQNWHLQFMQNNLALENGESYQVTFKIKSSVDRSAKWALLDPKNEYHWYGGEAWELTAGTEKEVSYTVNANATSGTVQFQITMAPDHDSTHMPEGTHTIEISDVSVKKTSGTSTPTANLLLKTLNSGIVEMETTMEEVTSVEETTEETASVEEESTSVEETPSVEETVMEEETTEEETEEEAMEEISTEE